MNNKPIKNKSLQMTRKYLRKMDLLLLLLHIASKKNMKYFGFHPTMTEWEAYNLNTQMYADIMNVASQVSKLQKTARTELALSAGHLPFGRKVEEFLDHLFRHIYFHGM